jgi:hypothetical protein
MSGSLKQDPRRWLSLGVIALAQLMVRPRPRAVPAATPSEAR